MAEYKRNSRIRAVVAAALAVMAGGGAAAGDSGEFYVNTYRKLGIVAPKGIRSSAMGGGGRGLADGVASLGLNPAALGALIEAEADAALGYNWLDDGYDDATETVFRLGGAANLERWGGIGGRNQAIGAALESKKFNEAAGIGMSRDQMGILAAYGLQLADNLLGGVGVGLFDGSWNSGVFTPGSSPGVSLDREFTGGDFRAGGLYRLGDEITLGGTFGYAVGSFREKAAYSGEGGSGRLSRVSAGFGVARSYGEDTLVIGDVWYERFRTSVPDTLDESATSWGLSLGVERLVIPETMALRGGVYYDHVSYSGTGRNGLVMVKNGDFGKGRFGLTAGAGVRLYSFNLGYSLDVNSGGDVKNLLDVSAEW